ncbi:POK10 protein, partial [Oxylabes madagascariensis]|nr:POK10 protein [Oxylabes madagascariensis]
TIVPQKLAIRDNLKTLADLHQLCGSLNWVRPWLGITIEDLAPLFNLLKGEEELSSPRSLTQAARQALEKVQQTMSSRQAHRCLPDLPFKFIILRRDPLLITEWVFLSHHRPKRITKPQELLAQLIKKARARIQVLADCEFTCIRLAIKLEKEPLTKDELEHFLQENKALQFALDSYTGQISVQHPAHKLFNLDFKLALKEKQSQKPLKALTVFTDTS